MAQMLGFPHQAGMRKLQSNDTVRRGPQLLGQLLGKLEWRRRLIETTGRETAESLLRLSRPEL